MSCNKLKHQVRTFGGMIAGALALAGCAHNPTPQQIARAQAVLPTEQFSVKVETHPEQMALGMHTEGLSPTQQAAIGQFVAQWRDGGGQLVSVRAPTVGDPRTVRRMTEAAAACIHEMGVPNELVRVESYTPPPGAPSVGAPLLVAYDRFQADRPNCSGGWKDLTSTGHNTPYDHFGCAVTANIAAQVANPRDFLNPAVVTPADDNRREVVLGKYRNGEITASAKDDQANGKVSDSVQ